MVYSIVKLNYHDDIAIDTFIRKGQLILVPGYKISSNRKDMDINIIHSYISRSYWAESIPLHTMAKAIENSLCFGAFTEQGTQVGFARLVTDSATFAYLADVFVLEQHREKGISKWLMKTIIQHPDIQGLRRIALATSDAHKLYEQFGFQPLASPNLFMELHQPNIYK